MKSIIKPSVLILLLINNASVFAVNECKTKEGAVILHTTQINDICKCNQGYSGYVSINESGFFEGTCVIEATSVWQTPLAIGGITAAVAALGAGGGYAFYKNYSFFKSKIGENPEIEMNEVEAPWQAWNGTEEQYYQSDAILNRALKGTTEMHNLADISTEHPITDDQISELNTSRFVSTGRGANPAGALEPKIKYDPASGENVLVDSDDRLLARWDSEYEYWNRAEGAEYWRYSNEFRHDVIATSDDNFLNPNTNSFQSETWEASWDNIGENYNAQVFSSSIDGASISSLKGVGKPIPRLSSIPDRYTPLDQLNGFKRYEPAEAKKSAFLKYNSDTDTNILVDKNNRLLANWDETNRKWSPVEGTKRWRYSDTLGRRVLAKTKTDFFNPNTQKFEEVFTDSPWSGADMEATYVNRTANLTLKGVGDRLTIRKNLIKPDGTYDEDLDLQIKEAKSYTPKGSRSRFLVKRNVDTDESVDIDENVLVSQDDRQLLAKWNRQSKSWDPVEGSQRWRMSKTFKYRVISDNERNFYDPDLEIYKDIPNDTAKWRGTESEYWVSASVYKRPLKGFGDPLPNLRDADTGDSAYSAQRESSSAYDFIHNKNITIKHDLDTGENVIVDNNNRLMARWSPQNKWETVDGAERWVHSGKFKYDIISTKNDASNFLNPNTNEFEKMEGTPGWDSVGIEDSNLHFNTSGLQFKGSPASAMTDGVTNSGEAVRKLSTVTEEAENDSSNSVTVHAEMNDTPLRSSTEGSGFSEKLDLKLFTDKSPNSGGSDQETTCF